MNAFTSDARTAGQRFLCTSATQPSLTFGRLVETVFKAGIGYDSKELIDSVRGQVGIR